MGTSQSDYLEEDTGQDTKKLRIHDVEGYLWKIGEEANFDWAASTQNSLNIQASQVF